MAAKKSKPHAYRRGPKAAISSPATDEECQVFRKLERQPAQLGEEKLHEIESDFMPACGTSQYRRLALLMMTRSGKQLIEGVRKDKAGAEALADAAAGIGAAAKRYRAIADIMESSATRAMVAICVREDANDLLDQAHASHSADVKQSSGAHHLNDE